MSDMQGRFYYMEKGKRKHINFLMTAKFNEHAARKEAKRVIKARFPEYVGRIVKIEWKY